jgi:elongation factor G
VQILGRSLSCGVFLTWFQGINGMRKDLRLPACPVQHPIGLEGEHEGVVDLVEMKAYYFEGAKGEKVRLAEIPEDLVEKCQTARTELIEYLANVDEEIGELFLMEETPSNEQIKAAIRRQTIARKFVPVFMGSAYKNKGVQPLLDGVVDYLPSPTEKSNFAFDLENNEAEIPVNCDPDAPLIALAFKLEESKFGQLTYMRIYQGTIKKGSNGVNMSTGKKVRFPRLVKMHSNEMSDVDSASAGDVVVAFGLECSSMDTFTDGTKVAMKSMFVPKPVMSISIKPKESSKLSVFGKAMGKFTREDPTLRIDADEITNETILSGMGELHLEIYVERLKREYGVECITGQPTVNYKEAITTRAEFNYLHRKQTGGAGQYARVIGYVEPLSQEEIASGKEFEFENRCIGTNIPSEYYPSCEKGALVASKKGVLAGFPLTGIRVVLTDGQAHMVDSSDLAFQTAMRFGIRAGVQAANAEILEPIMKLEVNSPAEFQGSVIGSINKRNGVIGNSDLNEDGSQLSVIADVPLAELFGYSTDLRSTTQGKGEFAMEYKCHQPVQIHIQRELIKKFTEGLEKEDS